jgi:hypothetical protein
MDFPLLIDGQRFQDQGTVLGTTQATALTNSGTSHVKGPYAQLVASTPFAAAGVLVQFATANAGTGQSFLVDVAIGAAAAEQVIIANLLLETASNAGTLQGCVWIPLTIPAGVRLAARQQNNAVSGTIAVNVILLAGGLAGLPTGSRCLTLGIDTATSLGAIIDPGGTVNVKGAYTELTASATHDVRTLLFAIGANLNTAGSVARWFLDIAVGAAAAETVYLPNLLFSVAAAARSPLPSWIGPIPVSVPAGTRLAARAQCNTPDPTDRKFTLAAYGIG